MATSTRAFHVGLYEEHLEEAAFLYEQRLSLFANPEITWRRVGEFEDRFEAHIDALVIGRELALDVCWRRATEGSSGETHAACVVFCRQNRKDLLMKVMERLKSDDAPRVQAVADALKYELPESWEPEITGFLRGSDPKLILIALEVSGYRRLRAGKEITRVLEKSPPTDILVKIIWALGRVGEEHAEASLFPSLQEGDDTVRSASALALLRLGDEEALDYCLQRANSEPWAVLPISLGGSRNALELLLSQTATDKLSSARLAAFGLLGFAAAVPVLINYLGNDQTATAAANSLDRITGAGLREEVFVPEEIDEDALFEEEREKLKQGGVPTCADGRPFGNTVKRVSHKAEEWQRWWDQHGTSMDPLMRYRNGMPYSPACLVADLEQETTTHDARRLTCEELVIRYRLDIPFEVDMFVAQQRKALVSATQWAGHQGTRFLNGRSYYAGKLMS